MNTFGRTEKTFGGGVAVWQRVDTVMPCGGSIDITALADGEIIPAGSMCAQSVQGGAVTIVKSTDTEALATVVGLLKNDIKKSGNENYATATIVTEGVIYADRVDVPEAAQKALTNILFVKETA